MKLIRIFFSSFYQFHLRSQKREYLGPFVIECSERFVRKAANIQISDPFKQNKNMLKI